MQGCMQDFSRRKPNFKILGIWVYMPQSGMSRARSCDPLLGGFRSMIPQENFKKNSAISCVLRAIFNHFPDKKSSQKIINKQELFSLTLL